LFQELPCYKRPWLEVKGSGVSLHPLLPEKVCIHHHGKARCVFSGEEQKNFCLYLTKLTLNKGIPTKRRVIDLVEEELLSEAEDLREQVKEEMALHRKFAQTTMELRDKLHSDFLQNGLVVPFWLQWDSTKYQDLDFDEDDCRILSNMTESDESGSEEEMDEEPAPKRFRK